ncbi:MAG: DUF2953 domain-containing protein [Oscillospiraceae bacterium]|jgi:hypothetical protein|nr:DUF2953 domain-containing protein [Oscillospiraceae bacterium]
MSLLIIIFLILLFSSSLLLFSPLYIKLSFKKKFLLTVKFLFFTIYKYDISKIEEIIEEDQRGKQIVRQKNMLLKKLKKFGFLNLLSKIFLIVSKFLKCLKNIYKSIKVKKFDLNLSISCKEANETALLYANICGIIYPVLYRFTKDKNIKNINVNIYPDFNLNNLKFYMDIKFNIRSGVVLFELSKLLFFCFRTIKKSNKDKVV